MIWTIILFVLEAFTLLGIPLALKASKKGPVEIDTKSAVITLAIIILAVFSAIMLGLQSTYEHSAYAAGVYVGLLIFNTFDVVLRMSKGSLVYGTGRALWASVNVVIGVIIISLLAFA